MKPLLQALIVCLIAPWMIGEEADAAQAIASMPAHRGVTVAIFAEKAGRLRFRFSPEPARETVHLYDVALPKSGLQGVGRPTLVEIVAGQPMQAKGPALAVQELGPAEAGLRSYPAGPVDLLLDLEWTAPSSDADVEGKPIPMQITLTYMACGTTFCLPPVTDHPFSFAVPTEWLATVPRR